MTHAVLASLIYAPLRPLLRLWEIMIYFLRTFDSILNTDFDRYAHTEAGRREFEAGIAFGEDGINLMIYARTCELLGVIPIIRRPIFQEPAKSRPIADLLARHARMLDLLRTFEQRAQRRATRILRRAAKLQSTSPAFHAVEDTMHALEVPPRRRRGRWIARTRAQDGGGCASPRGPPPQQLRFSQILTSQAPPARTPPRA